MATQDSHVPLHYHRRLGTANLQGHKTGSDLAKLYRVTLASTEIQQGCSGQNSSWHSIMVNTYCIITLV